MTLYVHHVRGRLRIQSAAFKDNPQQAQKLLNNLMRQHGIYRVDFRARTGSIVIAYDANILRVSQLLSALEVQGITVPYRQLPLDEKTPGTHTNSLLHTTMAVAWTRLVHELVGALLAATILPKISRATPPAALQDKKPKMPPKPKTIRKK